MKDSLEIDSTLSISLTHEIRDVFEIVKVMTLATLPSQRLTKYEHWMDSISKWLLSHQLIGFAVAVILAIPSAIVHDRPLANTAYTTLMISQLLGVLLSLTIVALSAPFTYKLFKNPFSRFLTLVERSCTFDLQYVEKLAARDALAVRYVLTHYEAERVAFDKRCSVLVGSVEKIGFFPALAGLATLSISLSRLSAMQSWTNALLWLILAFYILSVAAFTMTQKQDRVIGLLKYSLETRR